MKVLIIGGSRFVGPYVVDLLLKHKHSLTVFNRGEINSSYPQKVRFVKGDRNSGFDIKDKFDVVIDTCSYVGEQTQKAINELNFEYFLNFSSVAVYKDPVTFPLREDAPIQGLDSMDEYGRGKAECEKVLLRAKVKHGNIRPTYILGPKNYCDRENFIYLKLLRGETIKIPGNGESLNQFVFADEVARSIVLMAEKKLEGSFNCAGDEYITLNNLVKSMAEIAEVKPVIEHNPKTEGLDFDESEFPFANTNFIFSNDKIKKLGISFAPILRNLERDYKNYYRKKIST